MKHHAEVDVFGAENASRFLAGPCSQQDGLSLQRSRAVTPEPPAAAANHLAEARVAAHRGGTRGRDPGTRIRACKTDGISARGGVRPMLSGAASGLAFYTVTVGAAWIYSGRL